MLLETAYIVLFHAVLVLMDSISSAFPTRSVVRQCTPPPLRRDVTVQYTRSQLIGLRCAVGSKSKIYVADLAAHGLLYTTVASGAVPGRASASHERMFINMTPIHTWVAFSTCFNVADHQSARCALLPPVNAYWSPSSVLRATVHCRPRAPEFSLTSRNQLPVRHTGIFDTHGIVPSLYVLNAAAITKPHAIEHLTADLMGYKVDVAVITETHLKKKQADHHFAVGGYAMFRRDRVGR